MGVDYGLIVFGNGNSGRAFNYGGGYGKLFKEAYVWFYFVFYGLFWEEVIIISPKEM